MKLLSLTKSCSAVLLALSIGSLASHAVRAEDAKKTDDTRRAELKKVCADDFKKFCTNADGSRVKKCTTTFMDKFSPECRASVEEWRKSKGKS